MRSSKPFITTTTEKGRTCMHTCIACNHVSRKSCWQEPVEPFETSKTFDMEFGLQVTLRVQVQSEGVVVDTVRNAGLHDTF